MKSLLEYLVNEANKPMNWNDIIPMGRLEWKFKCKELDFDENIKCADWNAGFCDSGDYGEVLIFWSPKSTWIPYVFLEEVRRGKTNWALVSLECKPAEVPSKILANFRGYCLEAATIPELDSISVPKEVEKMIADIKKYKPADLPSVTKPTTKTSKKKPEKVELGDKISRDDFFKMFKSTGETREASFGDRRALMDELYDSGKIFCDQSYYTHENTFYQVKKVNGDYVCSMYKHFDEWRDCHYYTKYVDSDRNVVWLMTGGRMD